MLYEFGLQIAFAACLWIVFDLYGKQGPRSRRVPIIATAVLAGTWATGELLVGAADSPAGLAWGRRLFFFGSLHLPAAWLWTSASIARPDWYRQRPWLVGFAAAPQFMAYSTLYFGPPFLLANPFSAVPEHGPLFPIAAGLAFVTFAAGVAYSLQTTLRFAGRFDWRAATVLAATAVPSLSSAAYLLIDAVTVDLAPILFGGAAAALRFTLLEAGYTGALPIGQESVIEQLDAGVLLADLEGTIVEANPAAQAMLGAPLGQRPLEEVLREAASRNDRVITTERVALHKRGALVGYAALCTDRTEATQLQAQLADRQKLESLGTLAGGVAHDFNNLLAGILSNARTTQESLAEDHPARQTVDEVLHGAQLAAHLAGQLMSYTGKRRLEKRPVDLGDLIDRMMPLLRRSVGPDGTLAIDLAANAPSAIGDPTELQQVLLNLVLNAGQATDGAGQVEIRLWAPTAAETAASVLVAGHRLGPGPRVAIEVSDNGSGIDEDTRDRLFDPFFSTKARGHGLGLAATLGIVHGHGGAISVRSSPGAGSAFRIFLPATAAAVADEPARRPSHEKTARVLIVDDEAYLVRALETALSRMGFETLSAKDGDTAVNLFRERAAEIDVVLLDYKMPGKSGIETFREMRKIDPSVVALLSSGHYKDETGVPKELGFADFLQKPYDLATLAEAIRSLTK